MTMTRGIDRSNVTGMQKPAFFSRHIGFGVIVSESRNLSF
jgi:hypothetical protein